MSAKKNIEGSEIQEKNQTIESVTYANPEIEKVEQMIQRVVRAQKVFRTFSQKQVDEIFAKAAFAAAGQRIHLAKMAVEETGMGIVEDKVIKKPLCFGIYLQQI